MTKLLIAFILVLVVPCALAAERKAIEDVDVHELSRETRPELQGAMDGHTAKIWWIPNEFWVSLVARNTTTSEADKKAILDAVSGVSVLAVIQLDTSYPGPAKFYSRAEVEENMNVFYTDAGGKKQRLSLAQTIDPDLEGILGKIKPILVNVIGDLGTSMHFYVLDDESMSSLRLADPYRKGLLTIQLARRDGGRISADIEMPLNSLFVPRKCPNGKDAHISWNYCPWTGVKLED